MKTLNLLALLILISTTLSAQYKNITCLNSQNPELKIIQIDYTDNSTFIHFQISNQPEEPYGCAIDEDCYIKDKENFKKYKLLRSINMPVASTNTMALLSKKDQHHNFSLEFEKFSKNIGSFDFIENRKPGFNISDIKVDTTSTSKSFLDIGSFISDTPMNVYGSIMDEGTPVAFYNHKGLSITVRIGSVYTYGNYYQLKILITNRTGRDILFNPGEINGEFTKRGKAKIAEVMTYNDFIKKVDRRQAWNSIGNAISESVNTINSGYSTSTTQSSASGVVASTGYASGYVGNTYGSVSGSSLTYGAATASSTTVNYDPAVAYAAKKDANSNIEEYNNRLNKLRNILSNNYLKINTIRDGSDYSGFVNIKWENVDRLNLKIPINGINYLFMF